MIGSFRDLIMNFAEYCEPHDLEKITNALDERLRNPAGVYLAALSRIPESLELCEQYANYCALDHFRDAILSDEFQLAIIPRLLQAFPEYRRLLFVHIPKCAGSDLREVLSARYFVLDKSLGEPEYTTKWQMFETLHWFADTVATARPTFLLCGHFPLSEYVGWGLIRPLDRVFTIVREPLERLLSQVNYIVTTLQRDPTMSRSDSKYWCSCLQIEDLECIRFDSELAVRILENPALKRDLRNVMCRSLSPDGDVFSSALYGIKATGMEVVLMENYETWLRDNWRVETRKANASEAVVTYSPLSVSLRRYILDELVNEDLKLYEFIRRDLVAASALPFLGTPAVIGK